MPPSPSCSPSAGANLLRLAPLPFPTAKGGERWTGAAAGGNRPPFHVPALPQSTIPGRPKYSHVPHQQLKVQIPHPSDRPPAPHPEPSPPTNYTGGPIIHGHDSRLDPGKVANFFPYIPIPLNISMRKSTKNFSILEKISNSHPTKPTPPSSSNGDSDKLAAGTAPGSAAAALQAVPSSSSELHVNQVTQNTVKTLMDLRHRDVVAELTSAFNLVQSQRRFLEQTLFNMDGWGRANFSPREYAIAVSGLRPADDASHARWPPKATVTVRCEGLKEQGKLVARFYKPPPGETDGDAAVQDKLVKGVRKPKRGRPGVSPKCDLAKVALEKREKILANDTPISLLRKKVDLAEVAWRKRRDTKQVQVQSKIAELDELARQDAYTTKLWKFVESSGYLGDVNSEQMSALNSIWQPELSTRYREIPHSYGDVDLSAKGALETRPRGGAPGRPSLPPHPLSPTKLRASQPFSKPTPGPAVSMMSDDDNSPLFDRLQSLLVECGPNATRHGEEAKRSLLQSCNSMPRTPNPPSKKRLDVSKLSLDHRLCIQLKSVQLLKEVPRRLDVIVPLSGQNSEMHANLRALELMLTEKGGHVNADVARLRSLVDVAVPEMNCRRTRRQRESSLKEKYQKLSAKNKIKGEQAEAEAVARRRNSIGPFPGTNGGSSGERGAGDQAQLYLPW